MTDSEERRADASPVERLFERRVLFLSGALDERPAGDLAMALMTLDATGDEPITLIVDSPGGSLDGALSVIDTIDLLGVPVHVSCTGRLFGAAIGVVAVCARRRASANSRFRLGVPSESLAGDVTDVEEWLRHYQDRRERFEARLSEAIGQSRQGVRADLEAGTSFERGGGASVRPDRRGAGPLPARRHVSAKARG